MKKSGLHIKRQTDFKVGFFCCFVSVRYAVSFVKDGHHHHFHTSPWKIPLGTESAKSQLPCHLEFLVYVCVSRMNVFSSDRLVHVYVQKINYRQKLVPSEELILCKPNPDVTAHQPMCCFVGLLKGGFEGLKQSEYLEGS